MVLWSGPGAGTTCRAGCRLSGSVSDGLRRPGAAVPTRRATTWTGVTWMRAKGRRRSRLATPQALGTRRTATPSSTVRRSPRRCWWEPCSRACPSSRGSTTASGGTSSATRRSAPSCAPYSYAARRTSWSTAARTRLPTTAPRPTSTSLRSSASSTPSPAAGHASRARSGSSTRSTPRPRPARCAAQSSRASAAPASSRAQPAGTTRSPSKALLRSPF
jgi:hypothetical protein